MTSLALPPFIMTSEEGSFARKAIASRKPRIVDQLLIDNDYPPSIREALLSLKAEVTSGQVRLLREETEDRTIWDHDIQPWQGKSWLEIPWFLADTYFFRRVLEATDYFQPGPWQGKDPYHLLKQKGFVNALRPFCSAYQQAIHENSLTGFTQAVHGAMWGNQADLSNPNGENESSSNKQHQIIYDDSANAYHFLQEQSAKVYYFLDNVGKELYHDLALIDHLIQHNLASSITALLKDHPFFVSDVMPADFEQALVYLNKSTEKTVQVLAQRVRDYFSQGILRLAAPPFLATGRMFRQLPVELKEQLRQTDLAILKGDLNYRRLVGDRHWDPTTPVGRATGHFPTSFLSLRTLKAELIVGLSTEQVNWFKENAEPDWMTGGKWGLITFLKK